MTARRYFVCAALCSCAPAPPTQSPPPPVVATPSSDAGPVAIEPAQDDAGAEVAAAPSSRAADAIAQAFVDAANAGDAAKAEALSTPECWQKECGSFSHQAQRKFKVARNGETKVFAAHAVADAKILCDGTRECDSVHLLLEERSGIWRVADIKENDKDAASWLDAGDSVSTAADPLRSPNSPDNETTGLSITDAAKVVAGMRSGFRSCFNRGLASNPKMGGAVKLTIQIDANGDVTAASATSTGTLSPTVTQCLEARARAAKFAPPGAGSAKLVIPINFATP